MKNLALFIYATTILVFLIASCKEEAVIEEPTVVLPVNDIDNGLIQLPEKFGAIVMADTLGRGRHLAVNSNGDVYVHLARLNDEGNGIVALRDTSGNGKADIQVGFSNIRGTGIEIHQGHLYYSDRTKVYRSKIDPTSLVPDTSQVDTIVHLVDGKGHMDKPFTFDQQGNIFVNVGSHTNACQESPRTKGSPGIDPCVELETRAGIWKFKADKLGQQQTMESRYATGIRNAIALNWNGLTNSLFFVQHGRDDLHRFWPDYYTESQNVELPSEELHEITVEGEDFGWPYCYYDHFQGKKLLNPEYGGDGKIITRCEDQKNPIIGFPGHWGPNDILFYKGDLFPERYKNGAFIAFHGSWNRLNNTQEGYKVVFVPFINGKLSDNYELFADGFIGPKAIKSPGDAVYRPCGLAEGPDGSLYILDSQKGRLWKILYYEDGLPVDPVEIYSESVASTEEQVVDPALLPGQKVYNTYCLACHQANGKGAPGMNPPLTGTDWVTGDKERLIKVILNGMSDPIEINGETYSNIMASHAFLSDQQIADVLTYIRQSFGNDASEIQVREVAALRTVN